MFSNVIKKPFKQTGSFIKFNLSRIIHKTWLQFSFLNKADDTFLWDKLANESLWRKMNFKNWRDRTQWSIVSEELLRRTLLHTVQRHNWFHRLAKKSNKCFHIYLRHNLRVLLLTNSPLKIQPIKRAHMIGAKRMWIFTAFKSLRIFQSWWINKKYDI